MDWIRSSWNISNNSFHYIWVSNVITKKMLTLSFLIMIFYYPLLSSNADFVEEKTIVCILEGSGKSLLDDKIYQNVIVEQKITFNEKKIINFTNEIISDFDFTETGVLSSGLEKNWLDIDSEVSTEKIKIKLFPKQNEKILKIGRESGYAKNVYFQLSINRLTARSKVEGEYHSIILGTNHAYRYSAIGDCDKAIQKF